MAHRFEVVRPNQIVQTTPDVLATYRCVLHEWTRGITVRQSLGGPGESENLMPFLRQLTVPEPIFRCEGIMKVFVAGIMPLRNRRCVARLSVEDIRCSIRAGVRRSSSDRQTLKPTLLYEPANSSLI